MRVEYICHACLVIETGDVRITTDPWFDGPAYSGQWHVFPKPVNVQGVNNADVILISHGHEDHFHAETLRGLSNKSVSIYYPYSWFGGTKNFIQSMGFGDVREAVNFRKYRLSKKTTVTYVACDHDNILVIESDGQILININDALHSESESTIDYYVELLQREWPRPDMLFCGFGGASYFPNLVHLDGKDDLAIGALREQLFAHNFCRVVAGLKPRIAVPFAADFALLGPSERWINDIRFPRSKMESYYHSHFPTGDNVAIYEMSPGDVLDGDRLECSSPYRDRINAGTLNDLIETQYAEEIRQKATPLWLPEDEAVKLADKINGFVNSRAGLFDAATLGGLNFCLKISDVRSNNFYNITFDAGNARVERRFERAVDCALEIDVSSRVLNDSFDTEWGGDSISIGYGANFFLRDRFVAAKNLDQVCFGLLTRHPTRKGYAKANPWRVLNYVIRQPPLRTLKGWKAGGVANINYDRSSWLLRNADELKEIYGLPDFNG